jgi:enediyne polyketide synthase
VTAILHCAGINSPCSIEALEEPDFRRTAAVKVTGLRNLLEAADALKLRLLVSFGSIIARMGLPGQAGYAVANEWLEREMVKWSVAHPHCRCRTLEFSVWSGTGMGQRVARLESLIRAGISPISIDEGVRAFADALRYGPEAPATLVIAGRFGAPPTVRFDAPELPLLRFLERVRVHYPAVELVAEADLSPANDPYLDDHVFSQARLLPAVMALEAMAQTAMALAGSARPPVFEQVRLARPVIVGDESATVIRLAALARGERTVEVCLRSSETGFQTDHVQAVCRFDDPVREVSIGAVREPQPVMVDPARDLYGSLLFQANRFRRLRAYRHLSATECMAEAEGSTSGDWFSHYLPETLVLGDPGVRDAALHAIQACIPHKRVLPTGARRIAILPHAARPWYRIRAVEQSRKGSLLVYDLEIATPDGEVVERWDGLELRIVSAADLPDRWPPGLLAPYLERRLGEIGLPGGVSVEFNEMSRSNGFAHRPDGKPLLNGSHISRAHAGDFTFTVTAPLPVGCDCEAVVAKPAETWRDLLSADGLALAEMVVRENNESLDSAATRVWCALESAKKAGARRNLGIVLDRAVEPNGWVILRAGSARIATLVAAVTGSREPLAFAILVDS